MRNKGKNTIPAGKHGGKGSFYEWELLDNGLVQKPDGIIREEASARYPKQNSKVGRKWLKDNSERIQVITKPRHIVRSLRRATQSV